MPDDTMCYVHVSRGPGDFPILTQIKRKLIEDMIFNSRYMLIMAVMGKLISFICYACAYKFYRPPPEDKENSGKYDIKHLCKTSASNNQCF